MNKEDIRKALDKKAENARELGLDYEPAQQEYERGFIDGMQEQMKRSVDRAVNAIAKPAQPSKTWVGLEEQDIIQMAKEAGIWGAYMGETEQLECFYELAVAEERKKYDALLTEYEAQANRAITNNDFKNRLAQAIEQMPFGDTATSFATFVREFK